VKRNLERYQSEKKNMKQSQHTTSSELKTTVNDVVRWAQELRYLHARIASFFARPEPRHRCLLYLQGMLSDVARKNGWQLAEQAGETRPDGMQRLLSNAVWDEDRVRDELRIYALEQLGTPHAIAAIDETSFPKRGNKSAGVASQYCGTTRQVENCQVGVFLSYISHLGHTLLDRELYLPRHWVEDRPRCEEAGIPEAVRFQTKCELARRMMERLHDAQVPIDWVVADTVYGNNLDLRTWLEDHGYWHVLAVANTEQIGIMTPEGPKLMTVKQAEQLLVKPQEWQCLSVRTGTKGPLLFDWASLPILHHWADDKRHWLLIRRIKSDPTEKTYYLVFGAVGTTLEEMARAIGARWCIEEEFENAKDIGLDQYEVRSFAGWFRHVTLVLLVLAMLTVICAKERLSSVASESGQASHFPIALTVPEVRRLLGRLLFPLSRSATAVLAWSWWRRCHQARASASHAKRRLNSS
jgi:SRSO17 transposase